MASAGLFGLSLNSSVMHNQPVRGRDKGRDTNRAKTDQQYEKIMEIVRNAHRIALGTGGGFCDNQPIALVGVDLMESFLRRVFPLCFPRERDDDDDDSESEDEESDRD